MAFMRKRRNKVGLYILVALIAIGLLGSVSVGLFTYSSSAVPVIPENSSSEVKGNANFAQAMDKMNKQDYQGAEKLFQSAIVEYEKALKETPENKLVLGDLATSYFYSGNADKAIELVTKALEIDPEFTTARLNYAIYLGDGKNMYLEAIKELEKVKPEDPSYQSAQNLISQYFNAISAK